MKNKRYDNATLDRIDDLITRLGLCGATMAIDAGTIHVCFNNKPDAQMFGRFIRNNNFEEVTIRRQGESIFFLTADVVCRTRRPVEGVRWP